MSFKKLFLLLATILVIGAVVFFIHKNYFTAKTPDKAPPAIPVVTTQARTGELPVYIRTIGTVVSPHSVEIRPRVDGELVELLAKEGSNIQKGSLIARIDDREIRANLQQAKAERDNKQAQLNNATLDMKRYQQLKTQNAISGQVFDQQQALVTQLKAQIATQNAIIEAKEIALTHTKITAPIDGVVGIINVHEGNFIRSSDAQRLFSIVQVNPIAIEIGLPQKLLPQLLALSSQGKLSEIKVLAYDQEERILLATGQLEFIDNQVSEQTGTLRVRAVFDNSQHNLWPGQTVVVKLQTQLLENTVLIPKRAVLQGNQMTYVWRIENDLAQKVQINVLHSDETQSAVSGLQDADEIVIDGALRLRQNSQIKRLDKQADTTTSKSKTNAKAPQQP